MGGFGGGDRGFGGGFGGGRGGRGGGQGFGRQSMDSDSFGGASGSLSFDQTEEDQGPTETTQVQNQPTNVHACLIRWQKHSFYCQRTVQS